MYNDVHIIIQRHLIQVTKHLQSSSMIVTQVVSSPKVPTGEALVRVTENCSSGSLEIMSFMIGMVVQMICRISFDVKVSITVVAL